LPQRLAGVRPLTQASKVGLSIRGLVHVGDHVARADRIGLDAVLAPFGRHGAGQHFDAALGDRIGRDRGAGEFAGQRADIDDLAGFPGDHALGGLAPDHEGRGQVGVDHALPIGGGELDHRLAELDAGIVDEDVDRDAGGVEAFESAQHRCLVRDVEGGGLGLMPGGAELGDSFRDADGIGAVDQDAGAGNGQALRPWRGRDRARSR
jgi:hypothetical protein